MIPKRQGTLRIRRVNEDEWGAVMADTYIRTFHSQGEVIGPLDVLRQLALDWLYETRRTYDQEHPTSH